MNTKSHYFRKTLNPKGEELALHTWLPPMCEAIIFYIHGTQSHAEWVTNFAVEMGKHKIGLVAMDRRGSGLSKGVRGDVFSFEVLLSEYYNALLLTKKHYFNIPIYIYGQSLGASIALSLIITYSLQLSFQGVILCAPGIGQMHNRLSHEEMLDVKHHDDLELIDTNLVDSLFTDDPKWLDYIRRDPLVLRKITKRSKKIFLELEDCYYQAAPIKFSSFLIQAKHDKIVNNNASTTIYKRIFGNDALDISIETACHYIEFTDKLPILLDSIIKFINNNTK